METLKLLEEKIRNTLSHLNTFTDGTLIQWNKEYYLVENIDYESKENFDFFVVNKNDCRLLSNKDDYTIVYKEITLNDVLYYLQEIGYSVITNEFKLIIIAWNLKKALLKEQSVEVHNYILNLKA